MKHASILKKMRCHQLVRCVMVMAKTKQQLVTDGNLFELVKDNIF